MTTSNKRLFLGLDVGTQSFKACIMDLHCTLVDQYSVDYDSRLPHYKTVGGVHEHEDDEGRLHVTVPPMMFIEALDLILRHFSMSHGENYLKRVYGIAVSGQQHGSVYWKSGCFENVLEKYLQTGLVDHGGSLPFLTEICSQNEKQMFLCDCPIWMDSSTQKECEQLEREVGGTRSMIQLTGSKATERFTASHILRLYNQGLGHDFERISLISSFIPSLFLGKYAPIDYSDGSGMNLLDVGSGNSWSEECLMAASGGNGSHLKDQLGEPCPTLLPIGLISDYMHHVYQFPKDCKIIIGTGDNPSSVCGTLRKRTDIAISLGTSHTIFGYTDCLALPEEENADSYEGHTFVSPLYISEEEAPVPKYMKLICFKNGANARSRLVKKFNNDWNTLEKHLSEQLQSQRIAARPNVDQIPIVFFYLHPEITPYTKSLSGLYKYIGGQRQEVTEIQGSDALSVIESQCMALKIHAKKAGLLSNNDESQRRLIVTGGASESKTMVFILAQVFASDIYVMEDSKDSAVIGAACRAIYSDSHQISDYLTMIDSSLPPMRCIAKAEKELSDWYASILEKEYQIRESELLNAIQ